eukprot:CAMPEP_0194046172 /NCGR_PEP_ID=MMETSP0009_2-20130614/20022_1 /TAXON_ID=210454 /ORGANISM="Grammatophora oceanica, Strain CCMP 410" /LENGTH=47 /DNA_ID= /DNA_START= /DNA_END= /DNA_ORIENTATION=
MRFTSAIFTPILVACCPLAALAQTPGRGGGNGGGKKPKPGNGGGGGG